MLLCVGFFYIFFIFSSYVSRSFKEAGVCLKNYAYKCMEDDARIKTGLILSGISLVGGSFCGSQQDKEGL